MSNLVMDFIHGAAQPFDYLYNTDIRPGVSDAIGLAEGHGLNATVNASDKAFNTDTGLGPQGTNIGSALTRWGGNAAQIGLYAAGGPIAHMAGDAVAPIADAVGGGIAGTAVKGAAAGATFGGAGSVAQAVGTGQSVKPGKLTMDFLQGAGVGAATGGVLGAAGGAIASRAKPVFAASDQIQPEDLQKIANTDNQNTIKDILEPVTGPHVANELAPHAAMATDPNTVKNMVDQNINAKLAQIPIEPTTSTSDINTPQQVDAQAAQPTPEQASLDASQPEPHFMNNPGEATNQPTHVAKLGALQSASDIMNRGGTVDEAVNHYMEQTGAKYGEAQSAISDLFGKNNPGIVLNKGKVNASLNPEFDRASQLAPDATPGNSERAVINTKVVHNELVRNTQDALDKGNQLSQNDLKLMDTAHGKTLVQLLPQAEDKQGFTDAYNALKHNADTEQGIAAGNANMDVPYRQNHLGQTRWENSDAEIKAAETKKASLSNQPGWSQGRSINNYQEGQALGLTPKNYNDGAPGMIYRDLQDNLQQKQSSLGQNMLAKNLEQAYPGQVKVGEIGSDEQGAWKQLQIPYGQKISMPAEIADEINKRAPAPDAKGGWETYDKLNGNWKNLKLAGGGFHGLNTMFSWLGNQLSTGKMFTNPGDTGKVIMSLFDKNSMADQIDTWDKAGTTLNEDRAGLNATIHGENTKGGLTGTEADIQSSGRLGNIPVLKQIHEAVFSRQIPMMMKLMFHQQTDHLDFNNPDELTQATQIAKQINQQFGSFNRDIQGFTPKTVKYLNRGILAEGWNEGQVRTLIDAIKTGGPEGKLARQTVFGKAALVAGLATAGGWAGGEFKGMTPQQTAFDIIQKTLNPKFKMGNYTVGLPTTQLSEAGKPILETAQNIAGGKKWQTPIENFASARLGAVPSGLEQVATNRNFSGNPIMGTDYYGRPISPLKALGNVVGMASPIPVAQGINTATGQQNIASAIGNTLGVNSHQTNTMEYAPIAAQTYMASMQKSVDQKVPGYTQKQVDADTTFFEALGGGDAGRSKVLKQAITAAAQGNNQKSQQIVNQFNTSVAKALIPWAQNPSNTPYVDANMMKILHNTFIKTKTVNSNVNYYGKTDPTAYGMPIKTLTPTSSVK